MKIALAVDHDEMEAHIASMQHISIVAVIKSRSELIKQLESCKPDVVLIAHDLPGEENMAEIITRITTAKDVRCRIIYIYGEDDEYRADYVCFLNTCGVNNILVGKEISSLNIDMALFGSDWTEASLGGANKKEGRSLLLGMRKILEMQAGRKNSPISIKGIKKPVIALISNHSTGKTHTAWNLTHCLSRKGCTCSLLNIDRGYSANYCYVLEDKYHELLDYVISRNEHHSIIEKCYKERRMNIITGKPGDTDEIRKEDFEKLLYHVRTRSDMTLVDTRTGACETTKSAVKHSNLDLLVFDSNLHHYMLNLKMLDELKSDFVPEKTIAVINNTDIRSSSFRWIYGDLKKKAIPFIDIYTVAGFALDSCSPAFGNDVPYEAAAELKNRFAKDMDRLSNAICSG